MSGEAHKAYALGFSRPANPRAAAECGSARIQTAPAVGELPYAHAQHRLVLGARAVVEGCPLRQC